MSQQIDLNKVEFNLPLNGVEGQIVLNALAALPYAQVAELVDRLKAQFNNTVQALQAEAAAAAEAAPEVQAEA